MKTMLRLYSRTQQERAQQAAAKADRWSHGYRRSDGLQFVNFTSDRDTSVIYQTHINGLGCNCPAGRREQRCWHQLAAQIATEQAQAPKPRKTYEDLFGDDDLESSF